MLLSSVRVGAAVQKPPEDCLVCGHACCCPDVCAPLIKKMNKEKAAKHCGTDGFVAMSCDQPESVCRIQSAPPVGLAEGRPESDRPNPQFLVLNRINLSSHTEQGNHFDHHALNPFSIAFDSNTRN